MIEPLNLLTIVLMALVTYATRVLGYVVLRGRTLGPRLTRVMHAAPGCVLITVIATHFVARNPADMAALAVTIFAATRLSLLPTVLIGVATSGLLRQVMA